MRSRLSRGVVADAALEVARADGIDHLSLRHVASRLGVVPSALYSHIADRDDLYRAIAEAAYAHLAEHLAQAAAAETDDVHRVRVITRAYYRFASDDPVRFRIMTRFRPRLTDEWSEDQLVAGTPAFAIAVDAVQRAIDAGKFRSMDPNVAAMAVFATARGTTMFSLETAAPHGLRNEAFAFAVFDLVIDGFAALETGDHCSDMCRVRGDFHST